MKPTPYVLLTLVLVIGAFFLGRALRTERAGRESPRAEPRGVELAEAQRALEEERGKRADAERKLVAYREAEAKVEEPVAQPEPEAQPQPKPVGAPTDDEIRAAVEAFAGQLQNVIVGRESGEQAAAALRAVLDRATPEQIRKMIDRLKDDSEDMGARIVLAHALGQSARPEAIAALKGQLEDSGAGLMMHRFASHALAFSPAEGIEPFMLQTARTFPDRGVRANISFGLNRRGVAEGVDLYFAATDEAFAESDPAALQYLGGITLMGERAHPYMRDRLLTYKSEQALLVLINIAKGSGDEGSIPNLEKLAYDTSQPASIQKAAQGALKVLRPDE